ncbi:uncharacterized protein [Apostichopus japonicus]|uniref:uncharacterized protein n=1 Tax=Stichopus japonicus TaxID=307972 RepID=UPI003AB65F75
MDAVKLVIFFIFVVIVSVDISSAGNLCDFEAQFPNTLPEGLRRDVTKSPTEESETTSGFTITPGLRRDVTTSPTEESETTSGFTITPGLRRDETTSPTEESETTSDLTSPTEESDTTSDLTITPDIDSCPPNQVLSTCKCEGSCANSSCSRTCTDITTCVCPAGYLMLNDDCVPLQECGCYMRHEQTGNETVVPEGEIYTSPRCDKICLCKNDYLTCNVSEGCDPNADCEYRNGIPHCQENQYSDCSQKLTDGEKNSGVYEVNPPNWSGPPFEVYCDMSNGGGWTVFQRRVDGSVDFYRNWQSYKEGFGELDHEIWLGNDKLYYLTNQGDYQLRIDMVNKDGAPYYAKFDLFRINDESDNYRLSGLGTYSGTADKDGVLPGGLALSAHLNSAFSTFDRDNDITGSYNCAVIYHGAWWYKDCAASNLNGDYMAADDNQSSINWFDLPGGQYNIKYTEMKIRPI